MFIPALIGRGTAGYRSLERQPVRGFDGSMLAEATITPAVLVNDIVRKASPALRAMPIRDLLAIFGKAADLFGTGRPDGLEPEEYVLKASLSSGLPLGATRRNTIAVFPPALHMMGRFLEVQSPGGLDLFDTGYYEAGGIRIGMVPKGRNCGFVMPGNHPSTHFLWLMALAMKVPVVVRPSIDDPFTPYRLTMAFLEAGLPEDAISFVPGGHELVDAIVNGCSLTVLFGMQQLADRYAANRNVRVHGPGRSKVVVTADADFDRTVDLIARMVMDDAGRGCINGSAVVVEGNADRMAAAVADRLSRVPVQSPLVDGAQLGAVKPNEAAAFNAMVDMGLTAGARELTPGKGNRVAVVDGVNEMRPTVVQVPSAEHPLFGMELPFPFVVFTSAARKDLAQAAGRSLAVVVAGKDDALVQELLQEPSIDKVFDSGALSTEFDPREPHEGYLLDFLYHKKAIRSGAVAMPPGVTS